VATHDEPPDGLEEFAEGGVFLRLFPRRWVGQLLAATKRSPERSDGSCGVCAPSSERPAAPRPSGSTCATSAFTSPERRGAGRRVSTSHPSEARNSPRSLAAGRARATIYDSDRCANSALVPHMIRVGVFGILRGPSTSFSGRGSHSARASSRSRDCPAIYMRKYA
jgi:hypothetical protein